MTLSDAHAIADSIADWVQSRSDLKGLALAGSWSRGSARSDSDLDFLILAENPRQFRSDQRWLYKIALPEPFCIVSYWGKTYGAVWSCHAILNPKAGLELSFAAIDWSSTDPIDAGTRRVVSNGFRVVVDKDGRLQRIVEAIGNSN